MSDAMSMYVVYDHPSDYPEHFVVRRWRVAAGREMPTNEARLYSTLDEAREPLRQRGLACLNRSPGDDPVIVETWL